MNAGQGNRASAEEFLKTAVSQVVLEELERYPSNGQLKQMYGENDVLKRRVLKQAKCIWRQQKNHGGHRKLYKTAAAVLLLIVSGIVILTKAEQIEAAFQKLYMEWFGDHIEINFYSEDEAEQVNYFYPLVPGWLPAEMEVEDLTISEGCRAITYKAEDGSDFYYWASKVYENGISLNVDNERHIYSRERLDGMEVIVMESISEKSSNYILWEQDGIVYKVGSYSYDIDTIKKIVKNMQEGEIVAFEPLEAEWIPEKFHNLSVDYEYDHQLKFYTNDKEEFLVFESIRISQGYSCDWTGGDRPIEEEVIEGRECTLLYGIELYETNTIYWEEDGIAYTVESTGLDMDTLKRIVKSMK